MGMNTHRRLLQTESSSSSPQSYTAESEANFDTNMVIILSALLCSLIFALGLNSIVRCTLRCRRRLAGQTAAQEQRGIAGIKKRVLRQIPVAVYGKEVSFPATDCPICLGEFVDGERIRILPGCNHEFHMKCIDRWLLTNSSCPNCRQPLVARPEVMMMMISSRERDEPV
ncbi:RING-H2 finger protein ATL74-like [Impatiens glandulifera]|uniref:RING-H2 finger protein ATL74-like n=1 Tax=Impatiens glandulifera TaxID=253017 RepID=UPI001FB17DF4|nr:RING-H2 finger protein ATL74-like [Impatiens glandulifera]